MRKRNTSYLLSYFSFPPLWTTLDLPMEDLQSIPFLNLPPLPPPPLLPPNLHPIHCVHAGGSNTCRTPNLKRPTFAFTFGFVPCIPSNCFFSRQWKWHLENSLARSLALTNAARIYSRAGYWCCHVGMKTNRSAGKVEKLRQIPTRGKEGGWGGGGWRGQWLYMYRNAKHCSTPFKRQILSDAYETDSECEANWIENRQFSFIEMIAQVVAQVWRGVSSAPNALRSRVFYNSSATYNFSVFH